MDEELNETNQEEELEERKEKAFKAFKNDFKMAEKAKSKIDSLISEWNDAYYGKTKAVDGVRSKIVMKEIAKQIEMQKPNIVEPFLSTSHPVRCTSTGIRGIDGSHIEKYLNNHFTSNFNRDDFINELVDVLLREGTVWVRDGWEVFKTSKTEEFTGSMESILQDKREPQSIKQNENGTFTVTYLVTALNRNEATSRVCRNECIFPDPGARNRGELRFLAEVRKLTISELRESGFYSEDVIDEIVDKMGSAKRNNSGSSPLASQRDDDSENYGYDKNYQPDDDTRKTIEIVEYWGSYDLNDDGIAEPVLATWAKNEDVNMTIEDNPIPAQNIPYNSSVYSARPFSLWGNALAYFIKDNQNVRTGIVRGILDNMSLANNGQKFIKQGTMDYINFKRMRNGERHIIVNKTEGIEDGTFNQLPGSIFNVMQMFANETEEIGGVSSNGPSINQDSSAKDDNSLSLTMSQQRMVSIVRNVSNLLGKSMKNWISMAEVFLENEQIAELFDAKEKVDYNAFKNASQTKISIKVGTSASRIIIMQQLNMLLQQSRQLGESVPPNTFNALVAEMFELFDMYDKAEELRNYKPQLSPQQLEMQSMAMKKEQLEIAKLEAEIAKIGNDGQVDLMNAQARVNDSQAGAAYKQAQSAEKLAKTEAHQVSSALEPAKMVADMQEKADRASQAKETRTI